ncbi:DUF192 domain-containing protein, partial [bacterium]|nr:DUF192 domain-containing protein [bacterium]
MLNRFISFFVIIFVVSGTSFAADVCFGKTCFQVEVARTEQEQEVGLMYRRSLPKNHGMLFVFNQDKPHSFWMKNTYLALDMIWIDRNYRVVHIVSNARPLSEVPIVPPVPSR